MPTSALNKCHVGVHHRLSTKTAGITRSGRVRQLPHTTTLGAGCQGTAKSCVPRAAATEIFTRDKPTSPLPSDAAGSVQLHMVEEHEEVFTWTRNWWPIAPVDTLDPERPTAHTVLAQDLVVWWSETDKTWNVFKDICPHRLAPLSQGRLVDGSLVCSYHGWSFGAGGACNNIPQVEPAERGRACNNKRSCATRFPCMVESGCLFVWLDNSEEGLAMSKTRGVALAPRADPSAPTQWSMMVVPNDFRSWMEQAMDPSHANHLHAGEAGFEPENCIPMTAGSLPFVHPTRGFTYSHGGYEVKNANMEATRDFIPPCTVVGLYKRPTGTFTLNTMFVPVRPGMARTFATFGFLPPNADHTVVRDSVQHRLQLQQKQMEREQQQQQGEQGSNKPAAKASTHAPGPKKQGSWFSLPGFNLSSLDLTSLATSLVFRIVLGSKLPHWVAGSNALNDQDVVCIHGQEHNLWQNGLTDTAYVMPAVGADVGVAAINRWLRMVRYPTSLFGSGPLPERLSLEQLLDRRSRHVDHCIQCQKGLLVMNKICWALTGAAVASAALAIGLAAVALVAKGTLLAAGWPAMAACAVAFGLGAVAGHMWDLREERFVSGVRSWTRKGGLSRVKMA